MTGSSGAGDTSFDVSFDNDDEFTGFGPEDVELAEKRMRAGSVGLTISLIHQTSLSLTEPTWVSAALDNAVT